MCTIADFDVFCANHNIRVSERLVMAEGKPVSLLPNLLGNLAMYRFAHAG
jgi:hypothetical protein